MTLLLVLGTWMALACVTACFSVALIRGGQGSDTRQTGLVPRPQVLLPTQRPAVEIAAEAVV